MSYIENARNFLNSIACDLDRVHGCGWIMSYKMMINNYNIKYNSHYIVKNGVVRVVIIGSDFVIKVDYNKERAQDFGGCEREYKFWRSVKDTHYAYMFAPITKMKAGHHYYYVMPRMDYLAVEKCEEIEDYVSEDDLDWLYDTVRDLHDENYGMLDGELYIIDYACCS